MVNLTTYELRLIAGKRGIKNYQNMSREKLLSTLDESEHIFKDLSQNGLKWIAKMQSLSQNEIEQIAKWDALKTKKTCQGKIINCSFKITGKPCRTSKE